MCLASPLSAATLPGEARRPLDPMVRVQLPGRAVSRTASRRRGRRGAARAGARVLDTARPGSTLAAMGLKGEMGAEGVGGSLPPA